MLVQLLVQMQVKMVLLAPVSHVVKEVYGWLNIYLYLLLSTWQNKFTM